MPMIAFITLGCAKNEVDTDRMRAQVLASGFEVVDDPELADAIVINTCAFLTEATEETIATIFELLALDNIAAGNGKVVVTGCVPSRYGAELSQELPEVAAFIAADHEDDIVAVLNEVLGTSIAELASQQPATGLSLDFRRTIDKPWAYVKISDGCDRFCSFCTIPYIRGRYHSRPAASISAEVDGLVAGGVREVVLIGQDTGIWGRDLKDQAPGNLADLLDMLASHYPQTWFRVMYLQPQGLTDELLTVMAKHENICNYLDIPLQHASQRILKEMNRDGSGAEFIELLGRIRKALPNAALRTTVIAGFPGETRADVRELERFLEQARFDYVGVFSYSQEEGTRAGAREDQVPVRTRRARAQRLRDLADRIGFELNEQRVDSICDVLICGTDEDEILEGQVAGSAGVLPCDGDQGLIGRTQSQAPDVDGVIHLTAGLAGDIISARITAAYCYELEAEELEDR